MKATVFAPVFASSAVAIGTLSEYIKDLPSCSFSTFKSALEAEGCYKNTVDTDTFNCMCANIPGVTGHMTGNIKEQCLEDWVGAFGGACGIYDAYSTNASDWPQATSMLAEDFSGSGDTDTTATSTTKGGSSATSAAGTSSAGAASPTETSQAASSGKKTAGSASGEETSPTSTSSEDAGPTTVPKVLGVVGGAAVAIAPFLM